MRVKICGVKDSETVQGAVAAGVDYLGFMFAESKRKISMETAKELAAYVPKYVQKVGVFVNPTLDEVLSVMENVGLDMVQLHGDETPEFCNMIPVPVIKAFPIRSAEDIHRPKTYEVDYYLFDSPGGKYRGGSGMTFDWGLLAGIEIPREKVIVAGGLTPNNILAAKREINPAIVDVSSGVETDGVKDKEKIRAFIRAAKNEELTYDV
ncbi:phosphoribosylanthranilate isomerase [Ornithinibacillus sp. L9]|uniref:N-(5'-phosphoribosyl)anthranilate isomerase n=1 Tax=Ornithinibacillus caprae TaxID=2678566 RepID=A0A6N8FEI6_9BACI|nr:phosphoribosylanthranilate isomerase [Ornithinibacillus caprae]MUK87933.1 phosphoribosylanthranilate isomerase [Ornithinibacillus caprae]